MNVWSRRAQDLQPYVPGEQPKLKDLIKLNTNENPYPPSPKALTAILGAANGSLRLYPDPTSCELRRAIAQRYGVSPDQVFVGNGSDEVLALCFMAFFDEDKPIRFPDVTYSFYPVYCNLFGIPYETVALRPDFTLPPEGLFDSPGGVIFPNPNAPTSLAIDLEWVEAVCRRNGRAVIVDEAYVEFGGRSAAELMGKYENLLVVRTFSKSHSLAGLRMGYAMGSRAMIEGLERVKDSFNSYPADRLAQAAAKAAIEDDGYTKTVVSKVIATREDAYGHLARLGFTALKSSANFLFITHKTMDAKRIFEELRDHGVLVRWFSSQRTKNHLRVSVGTDEEMERLYIALGDIVGG